SREREPMSTSARDGIIEAVIAIVADAGFEGLSVRAVAARAGVSLGAVQHHFPTKAEMLTAAMSSIAAGTQQQYGQLEHIDDPGTAAHPGRLSAAGYGR